MAGYMGSEAYDFSLFEPQVIESPKRVEKKAPAKARQVKKTPVKKASANAKRKNSVVSDEMITTVHRNSSSVAVSAVALKIAAFFVVCCSCLVINLVMRSECNALDKQISAVQSEMAIAKSENVRLNAELSSKVSSDEIEDYVENVLGMVKAESHQISYIDLSEGDEFVVCGDKTVSAGNNLAGKIKELFAYIF